MRICLRTLVLQSHLREALTAADMGAFGVRLVPATPGGPAQDLRGDRWRLPDQREEQMAHFWHGEGQEVHRHYDAVLVGGRPFLRLRCMSCAR